MTQITIAGLANSRKTPGVFLSVLLGGPGTSAGAAQWKIILLGNKITTNLTGASPSFTVTAGTMPNATPTVAYSADEAATYAGRGSELHRMTQRVFEQYPDAHVTLCSIAESAGARASVVVTFVNTATAAYTVRFKLCEKVIDVAVANGDSVTTIADACADAILAEPDLPFTAQNALGVLTLTAKCIGPRGNDQIVDAYFVDSAGVETRITTAGVTSPGATTGTLSGGTAEPAEPPVGAGEYHFSGGTTADSNTAALAAIVSTRYHRIVSAQRDATNVDALTAQLNSQAGVTTQIRQQAVCCSPDTAGATTTFATGRNQSRLQIVWHYNTRMPPPDVAAQVTAARLIGDTQAGGTRSGEASKASANLSSINLKSILTQPLVAHQPSATEIETALNNGYMPLIPSGLNPTMTAISRSITSRSLANSQPNYAVLDTSNVAVCDYVADDLQSDLATTFAGFNLASDSSDGSPPTVPMTTTPNGVKARIAYKLGTYEEAGIIRDVAANMPLLAVVENPSSPGRVDCEIPVEPTPALSILGGNVRQLS